MRRFRGKYGQYSAADGKLISPKSANFALWLFFCQKGGNFRTYRYTVTVEEGDSPIAQIYLRTPLRDERMTKTVSVWGIRVAAFSGGVRGDLLLHGKSATQNSYFLTRGVKRGAPIQGTGETKPPGTQIGQRRTNAKHEPQLSTNETTAIRIDKRRTSSDVCTSSPQWAAWRPHHSMGGFNPPIKYTAAYRC